MVERAAATAIAADREASMGGRYGAGMRALLLSRTTGGGGT
jgi:hypothetical protein